MRIWLTFIKENYYTLVGDINIKVVFTCKAPNGKNLKIHIIDGEMINDEIIIHKYEVSKDISDIAETNNTIICSNCGSKYYRKQEECPSCHTDNNNQIDSGE